MELQLRVVLTGGGTGGHVYPALAIAEALRARVPGAQLYYLGTREGLEAQVVPRHGIPFYAIPAGGVVRKGWAQAARGAWLLLQGVRRARALLRELAPQVVVGTGGYVSGPVVWAAARSGLPTLIHEQNAVPGVTNRLLSRYADVVAVAYPEVARWFPRARRVEVTGNPVRPAVLAASRQPSRAALGLEPYRFVVLVVSGSRGARTVNEAVLEMLPRWLRREQDALVWVTGQAYYDLVARRARERGYDPEVHRHVRILPYAHAMEQWLAAADLVVSRAGAMTLAEIAARGLPSVLVPSPNVAHDEQRHNARLFAAAGAAWVLEDHACHGDALAAALEQLLADPERLRAMGEAARRLARPEAADRLAQLVLDLARGRRPGRTV